MLYSKYRVATYNLLSILFCTIETQHDRFSIERLLLDPVLFYSFLCHSYTANNYNDNLINNRLMSRKEGW